MNPVNLADLFVGLSNQWADRTAIVSPRLTLSYRDLAIRAARSARELRTRGVARGSNVGIAVRDSGEAIALMLALWMLDAVPVSIDFRTRPGERLSLADEFDLIALIEDRPKPDTSGYTSILVDQAWTDFIGRHDGEPVCEPRSTAPALISLSSGTTGRLLGIVLDHESLLFRLKSNLQLGRRRPGGRLLNAIPISSSGSRNHALSHLFDGGTVIFHPPLFGAGEFTEAILSQKATSVCVVPTLLHGLLDLHGHRATPLFADLDALYCFGAPFSPAEKRRARACLGEHLVEGYSSTVSGRISVLYGDDMQARPDTVGRVLPHVLLQIVDGEDVPLPVGEAGLIRVRSPAMAGSIYRDVTRMTGDRIRDGWAYPGDIGVLEGEGFLRLVGRASDIIIRGGVNVHPLEIETALAEHPGIKEVAVVSIPQAREGEEIAAFVVAAGDLTETALVAHCRARLAPDKRPRKFVFLSKLPRNANGKIVRAELRRKLEEER